MTHQFFMMTNRLLSTQMKGVEKLVSLILSCEKGQLENSEPIVEGL